MQVTDAIIITPEGTEGERNVAFTPSQRVEGLNFPVSGLVLDERSQQMAVDWLALHLSVTKLLSAAEAALLSEQQGIPNPNNQDFATNLVAAGKMMHNSGTSMLLKGHEIQELIRNRQGPSAAQSFTSGPVFPAWSAVTTSAEPSTTSASVLAQPPTTSASVMGHATPTRASLVPQPSAYETAVALHSGALTTPYDDVDLEVVTVKKSLKRRAECLDTGHTVKKEKSGDIAAISLPGKQTVSADVSPIPVSSRKAVSAVEPPITVPSKKRVTAAVSPFSVAAKKPLPAVVPQSSLFSPGPSTFSVAAKKPVPAVVPQSSLFSKPDTTFAVPSQAAPKARKKSHALVSSVTQPTARQTPTTKSAAIFTCGLCHLICDSKAELQAHKKAVHPIFRCNFCPKAFNSNSSLGAHINTAHPPAPQFFDCDQCGQRFNAADKLERHQMTHLAKNRYYCQIPGCGKHYKTPYSLKDHMTSHGTPSPCPYCTLVCVSKPALRKHIHVKHQTQHSDAQGKSKPQCKK